MLRRPLLVLALALPVPPVGAQDDPLVLGREAMERHDLAAAREHLERAAGRTVEGYEANWRLAHVLVDLGKARPEAGDDPERDALLRLAVSYARRAVAVNPEGADGHFVLANALGRLSLTLGARERLAAAAEIRTEALRALALEPAHSGAWHVLGRWHAEILRQSGVERFVARRFLGGTILDLASWDEAERNLREAVRLDPGRIFHRLDLALVLLDRDKVAEAREQLLTIGRLPIAEPMDTSYRQDALRMLSTLDRRRP